MTNILQDDIEQHRAEIDRLAIEIERLETVAANAPPAGADLSPADIAKLDHDRIAELDRLRTLQQTHALRIVDIEAQLDAAP